jgi:hypothetical protein
VYPGRNPLTFGRNTMPPFSAYMDKTRKKPTGREQIELCPKRLWTFFRLHDFYIAEDKTCLSDCCEKLKFNRITSLPTCNLE